jgi:protein-tyrosine phosphatase
MASFITEQAERGIVDVHCKFGYSRSAAAVASYLLLSGRAADVEGTLMTIRRARPLIVAALRPLDHRRISPRSRSCGGRPSKPQVYEIQTN